MTQPTFRPNWNKFVGVGLIYLMGGVVGYSTAMSYTGVATVAVMSIIAGMVGMGISLPTKGER